MESVNTDRKNLNNERCLSIKVSSHKTGIIVSLVEVLSNLMKTLLVQMEWTQYVQKIIHSYRIDDFLGFCYGQKHTDG